jgi:hypothetical protein
LLWLERVWVLIIVGFVGIKLPIEYACVPTTCHEASIIFKPTNRFDKVIVTFEVEFWRWLTWVKFENTNVWSILASEVLASMWELDFTTILNLDILKRHKRFVEYIHHSYTFSKTNNHLESTWM